MSDIDFSYQLGGVNATVTVDKFIGLHDCDTLQQVDSEVVPVSVAANQPWVIVERDNGYPIPIHMELNLSAVSNLPAGRYNGLITMDVPQGRGCGSLVLTVGLSVLAEDIPLGLSDIESISDIFQAQLSNITTDTTPPFVSVLFPPNGINVGKWLEIRSIASDASKVVRLELYLNNVLEFTTNTNPLVYNLNTSRFKHLHGFDIVVKAYDSSNNIGSSSVVHVNV